MKPKEKAKELIEKFNDYAQNYNCGLDLEMHHRYKKYCALISVNEILEVLYQIFESYDERKYWQDVKLEIENL